MRIAFLACVGAACAAAQSITPRQEADYGYWDAEYTSAVMFTAYEEGVVATYINAGHGVNVTVDCSTLTYRNEKTTVCPPGFSYSLVAPSAGATLYTLKLAQTVELGGENVTVYGSALFEVEVYGGGKARRAGGRVEAGSVPV